MQDLVKEKIKESFGGLLYVYDVTGTEGIEAKCHPDGSCEGWFWVTVRDKKGGAEAEIKVNLIGTHSADISREDWVWNKYDFELYVDDAEFVKKGEGFPEDDEIALLDAASWLSEYAKVKTAFD